MYALRQRVLFLFTLFSSVSAMQLGLLFMLQLTCTFRMCLLSAKRHQAAKAHLGEGAALCRINDVTSILAGRCVCTQRHHASHKKKKFRQLFLHEEEKMFKTGKFHWPFLLPKVAPFFFICNFDCFYMREHFKNLYIQFFFAKTKVERSFCSLQFSCFIVHCQMLFLPQFSWESHCCLEKRYQAIIPSLLISFLT